MAIKRKTCETCVYFWQEKAGEDNPGICRRYPPQPIGYFNSENGEWISWSAYPEVHHTRWCGEHQPIVPKFLDATPKTK